MSILKVKDLDYMLTDFLDDKSVFILYITNKYYFQLFSENFWKKRFFFKYKKYININNKYINIFQENWKKYYVFTNKTILKANFILAIHDSIVNDLPDLFNLIININHIDPCKLLNSSKYHDLTATNYKSDREKRFMSMNLIIKHDSINCFKSFYNPANPFHISMIKHYLYYAIRDRSDKIVEYIVKNKLTKIDVKILTVCIMYNYVIPCLYET